MKVIVIGGGASGLVSAIKSKENNNEVTILEQNAKLGKKLLVTGNGRCNFWNSEQTIEKYHSRDLDIFKIIWENKKDSVLKFFEELGLVYKNINGYYYPFTLQSETLVNVLIKKIEDLKINVICNEPVLDIEKDGKFKVKTAKNTYIADKVIMATGSYSQSNTNGYDLLKKLGHSFNPLVPALVPLKGTDDFYPLWKGVRSEVIISLYENEKLIKEERGEIQLTDYGVSGICIFNISGEVAEGLKNNKKEEIKINFVPWFNKDKESFLNYLDNEYKKNNNYYLVDILKKFLNIKIVKVIFKILKLDLLVKWDDAPKEKIVNLLVSFPVKIKDTCSFKNSQVCRGGVLLSEINPYNMESKIVKNLFLTGELLDVDGICGGYNLGFAWMSALLAGENND